MDEGQGVINERGDRDVDLDEFDEPTGSGDRYYDNFDKEDEIITEGSIVWVNTNKPFEKEGSLKSLSVMCQRKPNI